jgi:hypothetical protein
MTRLPVIGNRFFLALAVFAILSAQALPAEKVSFRNEVMAVLSKGGCNQGACHGNQNGKNGFKLSLRGEDPSWDERALTRDMLGRRVNVQKPEDSLLLQKATATLPHEGGKRFGVHSLEYAILQRWIDNGAKTDDTKLPQLTKLEVQPSQAVLVAPQNVVQLQVKALFSDGSHRDVTPLAVYDPSNPIVTVTPNGRVERIKDGETVILVRYLDRQVPVELALVPARLNFVWHEQPEANYIDHYVFAKLKSLRESPSALSSDSVFLRRAFLDAVGILPTANDAKAFLEDTDPQKRAKLIDHLLARPEFADFWALKWSDVLRNEEKTLDRKGVEVFHDWIRQSIADSKPLNEFARELIAGRGNTYVNPPANFYRALRDPQTRAEAVAQVFLGARLQCARCHNHPFDHWTQNDYHSFSAFFARVQYRLKDNRREDNLDKHEFIGEQIVWFDREGEIKHPRTGQILAPRFLAADTELPANADRLQALADWVARPDNPYFARTQVNRIWYHLLGRGIVEPNDDFRASNPPTNGPLLEALTKDFLAHRFDLRHLVRTIMNSRTYQLSAVANDTNRDDEANFSHALSRPLQAEQLLDAIAQVTEAPLRFTGYPSGIHAEQMPGVHSSGRTPSASERFMQTFGKPDRLLSCECERSEDATLNQAFQLITGELVDHSLSEPKNRIGRLLESKENDREIVEELFLVALSRLPGRQEVESQTKILSKSADRRKACEDLLWGLLNAKEFLLRR